MSIVGGKFLTIKLNGLKIINGGFIMNKYSVMPVFNYSEEDIVDIISSAIYDIGYWACI